MTCVMMALADLAFGVFFCFLWFPSGCCECVSSMFKLFLLNDISVCIYYSSCLVDFTALANKGRNVWPSGDWCVHYTSIGGFACVRRCHLLNFNSMVNISNMRFLNNPCFLFFNTDKLFFTWMRRYRNFQLLLTVAALAFHILVLLIIIFQSPV